MNSEKRLQGSQTSPSSIAKKRPLFPLGSVVATPGALDILDRHEINATTLLLRHKYGDFGTVCTEDQDSNMAAIQYGSRILSAYEIGPVGKVEKIWIITEADRSVTTLLLPWEY
jgi:hypothetical protein